MPITAVLVGLPVSGKGTQADLLAGKFGLYHFMSSKVGKEYISSHDDPETKKQAEHYKRGILFDPEWLWRVQEEKTLEVFNQGRGIVYDGPMRTLYEAKKLPEFLFGLYGKDNVKIIELKISEEEAEKRLSKRLVCGKDHAHSFASSDELRLGGPCPKGDGTLEKRDIDAPEIFRARLLEFEKRTKPALDFLKKKYGVIEINGEQSVAKVHEEIVKALGL